VPDGHGEHVLVGMPYALQIPVNPLCVTEPSDVKVTLTNPVDDVYTLAGLKDPECLNIRGEFCSIPV